MNARQHRVLAMVISCALAVSAAQPAAAESGTPIGGVTQGDVVWIGVAVAAIGAGIGIGIYFAVHHDSSLTGCAVSAANGLELQNKGDQQTYSLVGTVSLIKPGDRVRISGKRVKKASGPQPQFLVEHLSKDYGPCPSAP